jgi:ribosomal protein S27AE
MAVKKSNLVQPDIECVKCGAYAWDIVGVERFRDWTNKVEYKKTWFGYYKQLSISILNVHWKLRFDCGRCGWVLYIPPKDSNES